MKSYLGLFALLAGVIVGTALHLSGVTKTLSANQATHFAALLHPYMFFDTDHSPDQELNKQIAKPTEEEEVEEPLRLGSGIDWTNPSTTTASTTVEEEPLLLGSGIQEHQLPKKTVVNAPTIEPEPIIIDGLDELSSLDIPEYPYIAHHHTIKPNQYLGSILSKYNVPYGDIDVLAKRAKDVFSVTRLRTKKDYTVLCDSTNRAQYLIYKDQPTNYVVFALQDSVQTYICQRTPEAKLQTGSGIITGSLSNSMKKSGLNPALANDLNEIFAWTVDFFRLQKGDAFKVIYEEKFLDGKSVGIGEVKAAYMEHMGVARYAFAFEQDGGIDFFDEKGASVEKAFLQAPLKYKRISSRYNKKRYHPVLRRTRPHLGTDYAAPTGTPIMSVGDGVILQATRHRGNGKYVKIRHNAKYTTQYLHLSKFGKGIKAGAKVEQGQVIGYVGSTGLATGPHLCYRFWKNGRQVDPYKEEMPSADPVQKENLPAYQEHITDLKVQLDDMKLDTPDHMEEEPTVQVMGLKVEGFGG